MAVVSEAYSRVRGKVGLFDASNSYGRLLARGKDVIDLLHRMSTNDLKPMEQGAAKAALTFLTNEKGRIVDLLKVIRQLSGETLLITSAGKEEAVIQWLDKFTIMEDVRFERATDQIVQILLCGPDSTSILQSYANEDLSGESRSGVYDLAFGSSPAVLVKGPSLAGKGWFILAGIGDAPTVQASLESNVLSHRGAVLSGEFFDLLRIENGTPIAPNELNEKHNPLETSVAKEAVSFTKGCYIGQEVIARLDAQQKVQRQLMGLRFPGGVPSIGDRIIDPALAQSTPLGNEIGDVTSVAESPKFGAIGLGYVRGKYANPETPLSVKDTTGNTFPVSLVTLPFHD